MKNNDFLTLDLLNKYFESLGIVEKLELNEVKVLYKDMLETTNEEKKLLIREKIVLGTLYLLKDFMIRSNMLLLESSVISIEDVFNDLILVYIEIIDSGKLFEFQSLYEMFYRKLYSLYKFKFPNVRLLQDNFIKLLEFYNNDISINDFYDYCKKIYNNKIDDYYIDKLYYATKVIYDKLYNLGYIVGYNVDLNYGVNKLLISINIRELLEIEFLDIVSDGGIGDVLNKEVELKIRKLLNNFNTNSRYVISKYYGFDGDCEKSKEIGKCLGFSRQRIEQIHKRL